MTRTIHAAASKTLTLAECEAIHLCQVDTAPDLLPLHQAVHRRQLL
jgi:hypothetical protein